MSDLAGKLVVVTGATGNMGQALCAALIEEGAQVWAIDRAAEAIAALTTRFGAGVRGEPCDLRDPAAIERSFDAAGLLWGLVHTVGGWRGGSVSSAAPEDFAAMFELNTSTAFFTTRAAMRRMLVSGGGRIVTIASINAAMASGLAGAALYNASKSAVIAIAKAADEEGRSKNVRASCLAPNTLDTPQNRASMPNVDPTTWVALTEVAEAVVACVRPSSGLGGAVLTLPGRS
ncbi:MAG TPA: SDR family oxidoreductase [Polyangiales bacterium]